MKQTNPNKVEKLRMKLRIFARKYYDEIKASPNFCSMLVYLEGVSKNG